MIAIAQLRAALLLALALATALAPATALWAQTGQLSGVVYDSTAGRPLPQAMITLVSAKDPLASRTARTDARGRFHFDSVRSGGYLLAATHPRLDTLAIEQLEAQVRVPVNGHPKVTMSTPTATALRTKVCGVPEGGALLSAYVHGQLRDATTGRAFGAGEVRVEWVDLTIAPRDSVKTRQEVQRVDGRTDDDGFFVLCGIPAGRVLRITGRHGDDTSGEVELTIPDEGIVRQDLAVSGGARGRIIFSVVNSTGRPVARARLRLGAQPGALVTDSLGRAAVMDVPAGTLMVSTRAVGYAPADRVVLVQPDSVITVPVTLTSLQTLRTMQVQALRDSIRLRGLVTYGALTTVNAARRLIPEEFRLESGSQWPARIRDPLCTPGAMYRSGAVLINSGMPGDALFTGTANGQVRAVSVAYPMGFAGGPFYSVPDQCFMQPFLSELEPPLRAVGRSRP